MTVRTVVTVRVVGMTGWIRRVALITAGGTDSRVAVTVAVMMVTAVVVGV